MAPFNCKLNDLKLRLKTNPSNLKENSENHEIKRNANPDFF